MQQQRVNQEHQQHKQQQHQTQKQQLTCSEKLLQELHQQVQHQQVKEVSISSVTCTNLLNSDLINNGNNALRNKCQTSGYHFIDNNNIKTKKLWNNGLHHGIIVPCLHLTNSGKSIIIDNLYSF